MKVRSLKQRVRAEEKKLERIRQARIRAEARLSGGDEQMEQSKKAEQVQQGEEARSEEPPRAHQVPGTRGVCRKKRRKSSDNAYSKRKDDPAFKGVRNFRSRAR